MGRACLVAVGVAAHGSAGRSAKSAQHSGELVLVVYHIQERDTADNRRRPRLATGHSGRPPSGARGRPTNHWLH